MEGTPILEESPGDLGVLLWQSYRDVSLWGETEPEQRACLFAPGSLDRRAALIDGSTLRGEVRAAMELLTKGLRESGASQPDEIVYCCRRVAEWADAAGKRYTAFAMALAAAGVSPKDADIAFEVGRYAASARLQVAAEAWFRRTIGLGRRAKDYGAYTQAWLELGRSFAARGAGPSAHSRGETGSAGAPTTHAGGERHPNVSPELHSGSDQTARARQCFITAIRSARRHGMGTTRGEAYHELFILAFAAGEYGIADRYAQRALRLLGKRHSRIPSLRHSYANLILRHGENAAAAIGMLDAVLPSRRTAMERIETLLLLVEATGRAEARERFTRAWIDALTAIERLGESQPAARYLLDLAQIGSGLGEANRAVHAARRAMAVASHIRDHGMKEQAAAFLARPRPGPTA
jgi:tetratricopeptide (TPR) repeat protein